MAVNLSALAGAGQQFFDNNGVPLAGGKLFSYAAGTTTPQATYTSATGLTAHSNPIILDSAGRVPSGEIWLTAGSNYKFVLNTSSDVLIATWDNITGINGTGITSAASNVSFTGFKSQSGVVQDLADDDGSDWIGFDPAGAGAVARSVQDKLRETVSVKDFGAVGDGVADDTNAILNAIAYIKSRTNTSGYYGGSIYFPTGIYKVTETIELATTSDVSLRFCFYGDGGFTGDGATQIVFTPSSAKNGLVLKSSQMCSFEDIEFISGNNNVDKLIYITSENSPLFSSLMNTFRRCSFREFSGTTPVTRLLTIAGGVLTEFDKCWFSGTDNVIRLGESLPSTDSGGGAGQTIFRQCEIYQNIEVQNSQSLTFETCVFGRSNLTTPVSIYPVVSGFTRNDFVTFNNCSQVLNIANNTVTFFTQGAASEGLVAINNRFSSYKTAFNINGNGQAFFTGNFYQPPSGTTGCIAIILAANVKNATIGAEDFTLFESGGFVAVDDNRLGVRKPLIVDSTLATDYTFASIGNFETIISTTAQVRGGMHRIRWALNIETVDAATFTVRPTVNGSVVTKASALKTIPASTTDLIFVECLVNIDGTTTSVTIDLTCRQNASAAATVKADSVSFASFIQIEELQ
jgi:hypothetical protein